jgi:hypothetical protein
VPTGRASASPPRLRLSAAPARANLARFESTRSRDEGRPELGPKNGVRSLRLGFWKAGRPAVRRAAVARARMVNRWVA